MSNLTTFIKETLPEFVRSDHPMFESFISAYYEFLESTNTGVSTNSKDLWKELPNPVGIIQNIEEYRDIDETLDQFVEYFAAEVVPTTLNGIKTDPRFFIKKLRDLYLAKGTPKSFELFFKIFFNEEIDVYETKYSTLKSSDGKYFSFPVAHFIVTDFGEVLSEMDFSFSTISDSDKILGVILQGDIVDKDPVTEQNIIKFIFSSDIDFELGREYYITDTVNNIYKIAAKPMLSIEKVRIKEPGSLYRTNDSIVFNINSLNKNFISSISEVNQGKVEKVSVRNRGYLYKKGDLFKFSSKEDSVGLGGGFVVNEVDSEGTIYKINDRMVRSGKNNFGWLSNSFQTAYVPISSGGSWSKLPSIEYKPILTVDRTVDFDDSYLQSRGYGLGAQIVPISTSIGSINSVSFNQSPYFLDSDDLSWTVPANIIVENIDNIYEGDVVSFRYFLDNVGNDFLLDDSEEIIFTSRIYSNYHYIAETSSIDSEVTYVQKVILPFDFDSDVFKWKAKEYYLQANKGNSEIWLEYDSDLILSTLNNNKQFTFDIENSIDGGLVEFANTTNYNLFLASVTEFYDGGDSLDETYTERGLSGGDSFDFSRSKYHELRVSFKDKFISELDKYHVELLHQYAEDSENYSIYWSINDNFASNLNVLSQVGTWQDTGKYGKVTRVDGNVIQVLPHDNYDILTDTELHSYNKEKYNLVRLESVYPDTLEVKDEDYSPIQNIVHLISQATIEFDFEIISRRDKTFWDETGFLSSSDKSMLHDNYYYSDYSYNITSSVPFTEWRKQFKELLHPAGMILTATAIINSEVKGNPKTSIDVSYQGISHKFTFDSMLEYGQDPTPFLLSENFQKDSDNIMHRIEEFNEANDELGLGWVVSSDKVYYATNVGLRQQKGDSWWDYEPLGYVSEYSTQVSDGNGKVKNTVEVYSPPSVYNRTKSRYDINFPVIFRTEFDLRTDSEYDVIDSDLPRDLFVTFNDSDGSSLAFKKINYNRIRETNDNKSYPMYETNRKLEIARIKERDLTTATKENNSLVYATKTDTYYDYEAYEKKWNKDNSRRFIHEAGWVRDGYTSHYQNNFVIEANSSRQTWNLDSVDVILTDTNSPLSAEIYTGGNTVWRNSYTDNKVINIIEEDIQIESYRDPTVSMKGRRRW